MEENNRKGPGVFYAVVGVATLVVAIIGATFAYFSASTGAQGEGIIQGETNNIDASNLTLNVTKVNYGVTGTGDGKLAASDNLVPAVITDSTIAGVNAAMRAKCVNAGYTGCHVYKIEIKSSQTISEADLKLNLEVTPVEGASSTNWYYLVVSGDDTAAIDADATAITTDATSLASAARNVELHSRTGANGLTANQSQYYYLMVYLKNIDASQNDNTKTGTNTYELGSYAGTLELQAMGGQVKATFSAS